MSDQATAGEARPTPDEAARQAQRARLEAELLAWMSDPTWREDEARFERLAREVFRHQDTWLPTYRRFCRGRSVAPGTVQHWSRIPAVPAAAFK